MEEDKQARDLHGVIGECVKTHFLHIFIIFAVGFFLAACLCVCKDRQPGTLKNSKNNYKAVPRQLGEARINTVYFPGAEGQFSLTGEGGTLLVGGLYLTTQCVRRNKYVFLLTSKAILRLMGRAQVYTLVFPDVGKMQNKTWEQGILVAEPCHRSQCARGRKYFFLISRLLAPSV